MSTSADDAASHMLSRFLSEQEYQGAKRDLARDYPDLFEQDRQADAAAAINTLSAAIPLMLEGGSASPLPDGEVKGAGSWVNGQLVDDGLPHPTRLDPCVIHLVPDTHTVSVAPAESLSNIHSLEQNIHGVGAGMSATASPEGDAMDLRTEIEDLLNNEGGQRLEARDFRDKDNGTN